MNTSINHCKGTVEEKRPVVSGKTATPGELALYSPSINVADNSPLNSFDIFIVRVPANKQFCRREHSLQIDRTTIFFFEVNNFSDALRSWGWVHPSFPFIQEMSWGEVDLWFGIWEFDRETGTWFKNVGIWRFDKGYCIVESDFWNFLRQLGT